MADADIFDVAEVLDYLFTFWRLVFSGKYRRRFKHEWHRARFPDRLGLVGKLLISTMTGLVVPFAAFYH